MRLVELIGSRVIDPDGQDIGGVHDVRLVADGPPDSIGRHSYRLTALVVGAGGGAHRLGYTHDEMRGPWPLTHVLQRAARRSTIVPWSDVENIQRATITIRRTRRELVTVAEEQQQHGATG